MHELSALGWSPFFEEQLQRLERPCLLPARVAAEHRGRYEVWSQAGVGTARLAGGLRHELADTGFPGVGDWVGLDDVPESGAVATVRHLFDRRTVLTRGSAGRKARAQVVAANIDLAFIVCGLDEDYSVRRIERYLARIKASGAEAVVVLSKADLVATPEAQVAEVQSRLPGVFVQATSAPKGEGVPALRALIGPGVTAALAGSSGAGKSTLANALLGDELMATGPASARDGLGRHVTTHRQLARLPDGGLLLDTPGLRELQLPDEAGLAATFDDVAELARRCRFSDCTHGDEPGCAVTAAIGSGELDPERLAHFLQLQREARAYERRHDERLRRVDERACGKLLEAHRRMHRKRG